MNKRFKKIISTFLMTTFFSTVLMTNTVQPVNAQSSSPQVSTVSVYNGAACETLGAGDMALLSGTGWADWATRLIDLGCVAGSTAAVLKMTSPFVGAFCAGWALGRYLGG